MSNQLPVRTQCCHGRQAPCQIEDQHFHVLLVAMVFIDLIIFNDSQHVRAALWISIIYNMHSHVVQPGLRSYCFAAHCHPELQTSWNDESMGRRIQKFSHFGFHGCSHCHSQPSYSNDCSAQWHPDLQPQSCIKQFGSTSSRTTSGSANR